MPVVSDYTALLSEYRWNFETDMGTPVVISYSFLENSEVPTIAEYPGFGATGYSAFTSAQQTNMRLAMDEFEAVADILFVEVDDPDNAMIQIMNGAGTPYSGWAQYPLQRYSIDEFSYIVMDESGDYQPGTFAFETLLHELGHAIGLDHPFEGENILDPALDNEDYTLMSYTSNGVFDLTLAPFDVQALEHIYGNNGTLDTQITTSWSDATGVFTMQGGAQNDTLLGIRAENVLRGGDGHDLLAGRNSNDTLYGDDGDDILIASDGTDTAYGGQGNDFLYVDFLGVTHQLFGGAGDDIFYTYFGDAVMDGGSGRDTLWFDEAYNGVYYSLNSASSQSELTSIEGLVGTGVTDTLIGDDGDNFLEGLEGSDVLNGGLGLDLASYAHATAGVTASMDDQSIATGDAAGDVYMSIEGLEGSNFADMLYGDENQNRLDGLGDDDRMFGGADDDEINGGDGRDFINGDDGDDILRGGGDADAMNGGDGSDIMRGNDGNDTMAGQADRDIMYGGNDNDTMRGGDGMDSLRGETGNDRLYGDHQGDYLFGQEGDDRAFGGYGRDYLEGGEGRDYLYGQYNGDTLNGGAGTDFLYGGSAGDIFVFAVGNDVDVIRDWAAGTDKVELEGYTSSDLSAALSGAQEVSGQVRLSFGNGDMLVFATSTLSDISVDDFLI